MAKILKDDLIVQFLESKKATCLLPLIEMVGNLDELVQKGPATFLSEIPKEIDFCHKKLSDNDHILEDIWEFGTDEEIIQRGRERGRIRERRRIKKNEGVFLSRPNIQDLVESLILLLDEAKVHVTDTEAQVYFMKCRDDIVPASANKIKLAINNTKPVEEEIVKEPEIIEEVVIEEDETPVIEEVTEVIKLIETEPKKETKTFSSESIQHSSKDSITVKEGIQGYKDYIATDSSFDIGKLMTEWKSKFENSESNFKKDYILKAYNEFYTSNPIGSMEKAVADFAVWNHILPKLLIETSYFSK